MATLLMCTLLFSAGTISNAQPSAEKVNIVLFYVDDLGWKDVGFMGSTYYETPNIDKLAGEGMIFTDAYANAPNCAPSRASLMSGQYTPRHGVYTVASSARGKSATRKIIPTPNKKTLDLHKKTIAERLQAAGYETISIGKWHLGQPPVGGPQQHGFDANIGGSKAGHPKSYFTPYKNEFLPDGPTGEHLTDRLASEAISFIEKKRSRPFFLYLPWFAVHSPIRGKADLIKKYAAKKTHGDQSNPTYAAMIESLDQNIGRILAALDSLKLAENTVVIFHSDNGGMRSVTSMAPLRGGKGMLYEGGIRVPLAVRWPGKINAGSRSSEPVIGMDIYPTILRLAGLEAAPGYQVDGKDLSSLLLNEKTSLSRNAIFWHFPAYLQGRAKGARDPLFRTRPGAAVRMGDWKLIEYFEDGERELYNLKDDISEKNNIAHTHPERADKLHQAMVEWRKLTNAPVPTTPNPDFKQK